MPCRAGLFHIGNCGHEVSNPIFFVRDKISGISEVNELRICHFLCNGLLYILLGSVDELAPLTPLVIVGFGAPQVSRFIF